MTRINTNLPSLLGTLYMNRNMDLLNRALERMATGLRINSPRDDPSGVISADVLRGEIGGIQSAISNAERGSNLMATAEGSMASIADLLLEIKQVVLEASNQGSMTDEELDAAQQQIDNSVAAINKIVAAASFAGQKLLNGNLGYTTADVDTAVIEGLVVNAAPLGATSDEVPISVILRQVAEQGRLTFPNAALAGDVTLRVTGPEGMSQISLAAGATSTDIVSAFNAVTEATGLCAELVDPMDPSQGAVLKTLAYGTRATISVEVIAGNPADFQLEDDLGAPAMTDTGKDIQLEVNSTLITGNGLSVHYSGAALDFECYIAEAWNNAGMPASTEFSVVSGGALFQIGPRIGADQQVSIGIPAMDDSRLGSSQFGYLTDMVSGGPVALVQDDLKTTARIVDAAIAMVAGVRSRIGAFQNNTLTMAGDSLKQSLENTSAARSQITDADYAVETAVLTRQQVLVEATGSAIAMANQVPQRVLALLFG